MKETWRDVRKTRGEYQVSDQGRVRRRNGEIVNAVLRGGRSKPGYSQYLGVSLGKYGQRYVHRLVLESFVGQPKPGQQCCHANDDGFDNRLCNLRWGSYGDNLRDRVKLGTHHHTKRDECKHGHGPLDGIRKRTDGTVSQRYCTTCYKEGHNRRKREARNGKCANGHQFDAVNSRGHRHCTRCVRASLDRGRRARYA